MSTVRAHSPSPIYVRGRRRVFFSVRGIWDYVRQVTAILLFIGTGIVVCPACALLRRIAGKSLRPSTGQHLIHWLFRNWLKVAAALGTVDIQIDGEEKLRNLRGTIIAANHPSELDAIYLLSFIPDAVCVMRASLMQRSYLGGAARLAGYITNDQGPTLVREGIEKIRAGENLLIFPEGTRTRAHALNPFKHGFALIAAKTGAPIQTVLIEQEGRYLSKQFPIFSPARLPVKVRITLGEVFTRREGENAPALAGRMEDYFRSNLEYTGESILRRKKDASH